MGAAKKIRTYLELIFADPKQPRVNAGVLGAASEAVFGEGFRSPLVDTGEAPVIVSELDHVLFLRLWEIYRVLDLLGRTTPSLIETYSRFRERKHFVETLEFRYFDTSDELLAKLDPNFVSTTQSLFNQIYELRLFLRFTDALPSHVEKYIGDSLVLMVEDWNSLVDRVQSRYRWSFKKL